MAQPEIIEQSIISAIKTRLQAIRAGSEYYYGPYQVYDDFPLGSAAIPERAERVLNIRDVSDVKAQVQTYGTGQIEDIMLQVEIDIIAKGESAINIRKMKSDVLKSIGTDTTWGGLAIDTSYQGGYKNRTDMMGNVVSEYTITLSVHYRRNEWSK